MGKYVILEVLLIDWTYILNQVDFFSWQLGLWGSSPSSLKMEYVDEEFQEGDAQTSIPLQDFQFFNINASGDSSGAFPFTLDELEQEVWLLLHFNWLSKFF